MSESVLVRKSSLLGPLSPGARVEVRGEEWIVKQCYFDNEANANVLKVSGISGLVRGLNMVFLDSLDKIKVVDPLKISFDVDLSPNYRRTKLFIDTWLRKTIPDANRLVIGHRGIFKEARYQFKPAVQALDTSKSIRPRILMADAVGMGKTIQVGILLSELIRRGKANRILVVGLKSMLTQLQKEFWSRFSIPLKMMDSQKIEQVYRDIPSGMNPFNYYDKIIISMDTLKTRENMKYLEGSHWDVIVIDECHNVANKGKTSSIRSKLAKKLAVASDSLILTSATPHDGTRESYASLMDLLDPTLVVDPNDITKESLNESGAIIRRFRSSAEVKSEIDAPARKEDPVWLTLDQESEKSLLLLKDKTFRILDANKNRKKDIFFRSTLSKALFSSPEAFLSSIDERLKKLDKISDVHFEEDRAFLNSLKKIFSKYDLRKSPKYIELLKTLKDKMKSKERVVIFSEYRKTQEALLQYLAEDLKLKPQEDINKFDPEKSKAEIVGFNASVPEADQQSIIEAFAAENGKIKVLVTTDIASEGVNLHYACHNLVHFDVPWSFITLEQRNGRIDRFGQKHQPHIYYLVYDTKNTELEKLKERWVVEKLLARAKQALQDQGDERLALKVFDPELENQKVIAAYQQPEEDFMSLLFKDDFDETFGAIKGTSDLNLAPEEMPYLYSDLEFFEKSCKELKIRITEEDGVNKVETDDEKLEILTQQISNLEKELDLKNLKSFDFTHDQTKLLDAIDQARKEAGAWVEQHYLWENHPSIKILTELTESVFEKDHLPCVFIDKDEGLIGPTFIFHGSIANKFGQPIKSELTAVAKENSKFTFQPAMSLFEEIGFKRLNVKNGSDKEKTIKKIKSYEKNFKELLTSSLKTYREKLIAEAISEEKIRKPKLLEYSNKVDLWFTKKSEYLKKKYSSKNHTKRLEEELASADKVKNNLHTYLKQQFDVELTNPYVRPIALMVPDDGSWS